MSTNAENMVDIGLVLLRYLVGYANFCRVVQNGAVVTLVISGVTRPILINFAQDVATILLLNIFELELAYSYQFRNATSQLAE